MNIRTIKKASLARTLDEVRREQMTSTTVESSVRTILAEVKKNGDAALRAFTKKFDGAVIKSFAVTRREIREAYKAESKDVIRALRFAKKNIERFHKTTVTLQEKRVTTEKGVTVWREFRPIERVGLYIPGGKAAYPSTVLMLAVPATIAGCKEIVLCVPPDKQGKVPSAVLVAADMCGISKIFKVGAAQAIAAMADGTKSIPQVSKIFGPGNQYVTSAKMQLYGQVDIDSPAGPSEVLVFVDNSARADWIAADLLSQLEHGEDSQAILVTYSRSFVKKVLREVEAQTKDLRRRDIVRQSLKKSFCIIVDSFATAISFINGYAPEHLEIVLKKDEKRALKTITNAGSIFLGPYTSEPLGDYATGANHTLPTSGYAKMFSPVSAESFGKKLQVQIVTKEGIRNLQKTVETLAEREGLDAHKRAVTIRFKPKVW